MFRFFRREKSDKAVGVIEVNNHEYQPSVKGVQSSAESQAELDRLRNRVADLTHKAMRGGLSDIERAQIMHEADLLWTRLSAETQKIRQLQKVC